jgi:hypothetical protein
LEPRYFFTPEDQPKKEMLSEKEEKKLGFTEQLVQPKINPIDLTPEFHLPKISHLSMLERSFKRSRLQSLKSKFGKMLNLREEEARTASQSLCQYSSRRRDLSFILNSHSKEKERLKQLEEVEKIKEELSKSKAVIELKALSMGLCVPEEEVDADKEGIPAKMLISNPYLVESKKKKKKKGK